jgi:hypothetical protein
MYYSIHDQNKELAMNMIAFLPLLCCEPKRARSDGWFHRFHGYVIVAVLQNVSPALSPPSTDRRRCAGASKTAGIRDGLESHALTRRPNERGPHASSPCVHVVDMRARAPDDLLLLPPKKTTPTRRVAREQSVVWYAYQALAISKHVVSVKPLCVHERINREYASRPIVAGQVLPAGPARDSRLRSVPPLVVAVAAPPVGLGVRAVRPAVEREDAHCTMDTQSAAG